MKTGIIRRTDDLGRICIPREIRNRLHIEVGEPLEIIPTDEGILLKKYNSEENIITTLNSIMNELGNEYNEASEKLEEAIRIIRKNT